MNKLEQITEKLARAIDNRLSAPRIFVERATARERLNVYAGIAMGSIAPAVLLCAMLPSYDAQSVLANAGIVAAKGIVSVVATVSAAKYGAVAGGILGASSANRLRRLRLQENQYQNKESLDGERK